MWDPEQPPAVGFSFVKAHEGDWTPGANPALAYRDLGLVGASDGALDARHLRATGAGCDLEWHVPEVAFHLLFVAAGTVELESAAGTVALGPDDCAQFPPRYRQRARTVSSDFEAITVTVPVTAATTSVAETGPSAAATAEPHVSRASDGYNDHDLRAFLQRRNLGVAARTDGRLDAIVAKTSGEVPSNGTGWHYHAMSEFVVVLTGSVRLEVIGEHDRSPVHAWDAMCIGAGLRHRASRQSPDYSVFVLRLPEKFETIAVDEAAP
jgi:quercetin dioxygenase-like cupin family protein